MEWANRTIDSTVTDPGFVDNIKWAVVTLDSSGFGFYWNLVALTLVVILILAYVETRPQAPQNTTSTPPPLPPKEEELPSLIFPNMRELLQPPSLPAPTKKPVTTKDKQAPQAKSPIIGDLLQGDAFTPAKVTQEQIVDLHSSLQRINKRTQDSGQHVQIKIVSLLEHLEFAKLLVKAFETTGYDIVEDKESATQVFIAKRKHGKLKLRYREIDDPSYTSIYQAMRLAFFTFPGYEREDFPRTSDIDYLQIELGGAP